MAKAEKKTSKSKMDYQSGLEQWQKDHNPDYEVSTTSLSDESSKKAASLNEDWDQTSIGKETNMENDARSQIRENASNTEKTEMVDTDSVLAELRENNEGSDTKEVIEAEHETVAKPASTASVEPQETEAIRESSAVIALGNVEKGGELDEITMPGPCFACLYLMPNSDHPNAKHQDCFTHPDCPAKQIVFADEPVSDEQLDEICRIAVQDADLSEAANALTDVYEKYNSDPKNYMVRKALQSIVRELAISVGYKIS